MAEFKLGRIRFVWQGLWTTGTPYIVDDVVNRGGKSYICVVNHTAAAGFATDLNAIPSRWNLVADGTSWKGDWAPSTQYDAGDQVKYGGIVYICSTGHTSATFVSPTYLGLENDLSKWTEFASSFSWTGNWSANTRYKLNDFVKYSGVTYICNLHHVSSASATIGLEPDLSKWTVFSDGISYVGTWATAIRYKLNEVVKYGADLWICGTHHTSSTFVADNSNWSIFVAGIQFENSWSNATIYQVGDIVTYGGYTYVAKTVHSNKSPISNASDWDVFTTGFNFKSDWDSGTSYKIGDVVRLYGYTYVALADSTNDLPPSAVWSKLNSGISWTNNAQTYSAVSGTNLTGTGSGAKFDVIRSKTVYTITIASAQQGTGYVTGNTIKILGSSVGGLSPVNNIVITVNAPSGAVTGITWTGTSVTWTSGITYSLGDIVTFGANSYICVLTHTAATGNRPDNDTTGTNWNAFALGADINALTTQGDMLYYGQTGPTRLPVGIEGQILRVTNGYPTWSNYGLINNLVYVGPLGSDIAAPSAGLTIDKPWKSVRFACHQVENGYQNPNAKSLIVRNKQFIMKEVNNYLLYTYKVAVTGTSGGAFTATSTAMLSVNMPIRFANTNGGVSISTTYYIKQILSLTLFTVSTVPGSTAFTASGSGTNTGTFYYDQTKAERDAGIIVEAVAHDISRLGTQKITAAALAYFNSTGTTYITTTTGYEATQLISAVNYLSTLLSNVLNNFAPTSNYQTLNSVSITANQIIDVTVTAETGVVATAQSLVSIVTTGLTSGSAAAVPTAIVPNTTISVKTGTFTEILPIVLPANTAIVGDELRNTVLQPAPADGNLATVKPKIQLALTRIKSVIPDLIANTTITPTIGNITPQVKTLPAGSTGSSTVITNLKSSFDVLYGLVASGLGGEPSIVRPLPTGYASTLVNTAYSASGNATGDTTGYGFAITQIQKNYAFIVAELNAYVSTLGTYSSSDYGKGYRDTTYMLDSIIYDLTYGGNYQSNIAGSSFYSLYLLSITATDKTPFITTMGRLKTIIAQVIQQSAVSVTSGNTVTQVTTGTAGSVNSATFAQERVQNIVNWVTNSTSDTAVSPYIGWVSLDLQTAYAALVDRTSNIQADAVSWSQKFFQPVAVSAELASRDAGLVITSLAYDMIFGSNFNAIQAGRSYNRAISSDIKLRSGPVLESVLGSINFMYYKAKQIVASGAVVQIQTTIDDISNFLIGGASPPVITLPQPKLPAASYTGVTGTVLSGNGNGLAAFTITRVTNNNGFYTYNIVPTTAGASYTTSSKIKILGTSIGGATPTNDIVLNVTQVTTGGVIAVTFSDPIAAVGLIESNKSFILAEVIAYINANYSSITADATYSVAKTQRDASYILDAIKFDLMYGGNWACQNAGMSYYSTLYGTQVTTGFTAAFVNTVGYMNTLLQSIIVGTAVGSQLQVAISQIIPPITQPTGAIKDATQITALTTLITNFITNGLTIGAPTITVTTIATSDTITSNGHGLSNGDIIIPQATLNGLTLTIVGSGIQYFVVSANTNTFKVAASYNGTALTSLGSGTGLTLKLQVINMPNLSWVTATSITAYTSVTSLLSTYQSSVITYIDTNYPALTYNSTYASRDAVNVVMASMLDMLLDSNYAGIQAGRAYNRSQDYKLLGYERTATIAALNYLETLVESTLSSMTYLSQLTAVQTSIYLIIKLLQNGSGVTPEINGTVTYNNNLGIIKGSEILRANIPFLTAEAVALYTTRFGGDVATTTSGSNEFTTSLAHNFVVNDPVVFSGSSVNNITNGTTYYVSTVTSPTTFTVTTNEGYLNSNNGSFYPTVGLATQTLSGVSVAYSFSPANAINDLTNILNGIVYDLQYTGNYKSLRYAEVLNNAINGSQTSNMLLGRNGTGLRNVTTSGLFGTLSNPNSYGTRRPTAGAYFSLDPGFGPNDSNTWIITRSPYVQNVTTFGTGCAGLKIDGALHNGGNRSVVANDYTQVLSDGIGVWCTGNNSLTELVSVFSYYGYSGYLAELGGRIRATNGNSSYGTWGVIAEGTDVTETPISCILDNHSQQAQITNVFTDSTNKVLRFEYGNAGSHYTNTVIGISGAGYNAAAIADEFRDAAVFETRIIDLNDGNGYGGTNYGTAINAAQNGTSTYITIAATDISLSTAYATMRIQLTAGSGVGQYGNILLYNNGTKVALVYKDSFTNLTVTATAITNNLLTVASTATMYVGMPIYLNTTVNGLTANTLYYVIAANFSNTQFAVSTALGGSAVTITTTGSVSITLYAAGWDHAVAGTAITSTLDLTTQYNIEPRVSYTAPGYTATARTLLAASTWGAATYGNSRYVAISSIGTATQYSTDGKTWAVGGILPAAATWSNVVYGGGQGASAYAVIGGLGGSGAILTAVLGSANSIGAPGADQVLSVTIVNGGVGYYTSPTIVFTPVSGGTGAVATCAVLNGAITSVTVTSNGTAYLAAPTVSAATDRVTKLVFTSWGSGYTGGTLVSLSGGGSSNQATGTAVLTNTGVSSITIGNTGGSGYTSTPTVSIVDTNAKFVAIAAGATNTASTSASAAATSNWTAGSALPASTFADLSYGNGIYVAVGGTASAASSTDAVTWVTRTIPTLGAGTYSAVTYGNGYFVAISTGNLVTAISTNGIAWSAGGNLPSNTTWTSVTYGNGRFVAVASGGRVTAFSIDNGTTWYSYSVGLPVSATWSTIKYGQGLFFAVAQATTSAATSPDGINWTLRTMPGTSTNWKGLAFGNVASNPLWVATSNTSGTIAASIYTGAQTLGRMKASSGILGEMRIIEPGSGYPKGTITASTVTTNLITANNTENLVDSQPVVFTGTGTSGLTAGNTYFVIGSTITSTRFKVSATAGSATAVTLETATLTGTYRAGPILTQYDPNKVITAALTVRTGDGALGNPSFSNRGTNNTTATATTQGDGYADLYQPSTFITVKNLYAPPQPGSNLTFSSIPNSWYKLVSIGNVLGSAGDYSATFQISPGLSVLLAPAYGDTIATTIKYSQVRLTGHDFLYIGTGNQSTTNFPYVIPTTADITKQELASGGGRVFFTSTDQDGNFNVGNLFGVQQSTGTATLNASAFNLSGLQSLQLGSVSLGIGSAVITQFSTDPYFTANSDSILPTQRAIKAYITSQIGGGLSSLNVNTLTAGVVYIANNTISTTNGGQINVTAKMNFTGGIDGAPVALSFFMQR